MAQMRDDEAEEVPPFNALQLGPDPLTRVSLQGIGGQVLQVEVMRRAVREEPLMVWLRGIGAPSQTRTIRPGTSRRKESRNAMMLAESVWSLLIHTLHPLADGGLDDARRLGNLPLRPAFLLEVPGLQTSSFFSVFG